ncbi:MAG: cytochrome c peroxidase [Planctomycetota bacterium]
MKRIIVASLLLLVGLTAVHGAEPATARKLSLPDVPFRYSESTLPEHVQHSLVRLDNTPADNPISDEGATLGRVLFYDPTLSANSTTSCASCHQQKFAFTDGVKVSTGFEGREVTRNSMSLVNLRYYQRGKFFWDERAESLEEQVLMPIENPVEMGHDLYKLTRQLAEDPIYPPLFESAFGDASVTRERIAKALSQFLRSITSFQSRYDVGLAQVRSPRDPFPNFSDEENLGKDQFFGRALCADCHLPEHDKKQWAVFQLSRPGNNGIDSNLPGDDVGVAERSGKEADRGLFKPSTLRNLDVTGPYMHDGRFHTVDQVIEHYNWSVRPHENLDSRLQDFMANGMALPEVEKVALAKFLSTLTDEQMLTDERYSDPFAP